MFKFIGDLFNYDKEKALAKEMAAQVGQAVSVKLMNDRRQVLSAKKISHSLEQTFQLAKNYQSQRKLGTVRRAILANSFRWELKESGYPDDFIAIAIEGLIVELDRPQVSKKSR